MGADSDAPDGGGEGLDALADANAPSSDISLDKSDPPKSDPPKSSSDPPRSESDPPKSDPPKSDPPKSDPPKSDPPKSDSDPPVRKPADSDPGFSRMSDPDGPRSERVEALMDQGDYHTLSELLGPLERARKRPPMQGLLYAIAQKELDAEDPDNQINMLAINSVAKLFGLPPKSHTAVVIAKRLLRRQAAWRQRPAPAAPARVLITIIGLIVGIVVGWMVGPGSVRIMEVIKELSR